MTGCVALRFASGFVEELDFGLPGTNETYFELLNVTQSYNDCTDRFCDYGTAVDQQVSFGRILCCLMIVLACR